MCHLRVDLVQADRYQRHINFLKLYFLAIKTFCSYFIIKQLTNTLRTNTPGACSASCILTERNGKLVYAFFARLNTITSSMVKQIAILILMCAEMTNIIYILR